MSERFWSSPGVEPKRQFKWLLSFHGMPQFVAKSVTKPSVQIASTTHNFLQHQFNFPGRVIWQPITITVVDPVQPDSAQSLYNIIANSGYVIPTEVPANKTTIFKDNMVDSLGTTITIDQIGSGGATDILEQWTLNNPILTSINWGGDLTYDAEAILNLTLGISYDWAELNKNNERQGLEVFKGMELKVPE
tara:strand:+ start:205 stop:777 length:573 start_codon:yes stop_codon:yes gene_type:complete